MKIIVACLICMAAQPVSAQSEWKSYFPDSCYVYALPFSRGKSYLMVQGYNSKFSHEHEIALDFKMKKGSLVCASREGIVERIKEDSDVRGLKPKYLSLGNYIIIRHSDGGWAEYWHFKKDGVIINEGDTVRKGQPIGYSGNTGYSAFPHLHIQVFDRRGNDIPCLFQTGKGVKYLRPGRWYRAQ